MFITQALYNFGKLNDDPALLFTMDSSNLESRFNTLVNSAEISTLAPIDAPKDVLATVEQDNTMNISWTGPSVPNGPIQACLLEVCATV